MTQDIKTTYVDIKDVDLEKLEPGWYWLTDGGEPEMVHFDGGVFRDLDGLLSEKVMEIFYTHISGPIAPPKMESENAS